MATADSVKAKIQGLIAKANDTTGNADADLTTAVQSLCDGYGQGDGGAGIAVPKMAVAYFPISLSIPSNLGKINVDFSTLFDYLNANQTYTYSLVLYKNSVTEYTDLTHITNALNILGRIGHTGSVPSLMFDYNNQVQARSSSGSMISYVLLNVASAFSEKSMINGVASMALGSNSQTDFIGEWIGIFVAIAPFTSTEPTNKLTECPANFLTYTEVI